MFGIPADSFIEIRLRNKAVNFCNSVAIANTLTKYATI